MEETHSLYLMISHTDTGIGKVIRYFTDYDYNHVSLSLDPALEHWVSFARYAKNVPLAGGFVEETAERFFADDSEMPVRIFRLDIPESKYRILRKLFAEAGHPECGLIYNTFGAVLSSIGIDFPVTGAYTCLEFANAVLGESHDTIEQLNDRLTPHLIFSGDLHELISQNGSHKGNYFVERSFLTAAKETMLHFARLLRNTVSPNRPDPIANRLRFH